MKKLISLLLIIVMVFSLGGCKKIEADLDIWIATDNHYLSPSLHDGGEFFLNAITSADGKVTHYSSEVISALLDSAKTEKPDILILSGDLTLNGATKSHTELAQKLKAAEEAGVCVLVIPGNHDVESTGVDFSGGKATAVDSLSSTKFPEIYSDFGYSEAISRDTASFSYIYETEGKLRILMLDTNSFGKGYVNDVTYVWLEKELNDAKKAGCRVMSVTHQTLFAHNKLLSFGYQLYDADELMELYKKYNVKCNFSGHIHVQSIKEEDGFTEVVTSSLTMAPIQYGKIHYDGKSLSYTASELDVSAWAKSQNLTDPNLTDFRAYSIGFFENLSRNQVYSTLENSSFTDDEKAVMAETFAKVNTKYFAGDRANAEDFSEGIVLWKKHDSFFISYIETMLTTPENCKTVNIKF